MFDRDSLIGLLLLGLCLAVGGALVYSIATGTRFQFTGPGWLGVGLMVFFFGAILYGVFSSGRRWPDPLTGRGRWRWPWSRKQEGDDR
ncbi:MAG: hypothetical protein M3354_00070 [Chloroflexota bacterium]|nr:hypothetical protein [Chloroflexota bacterium]